MIYDICRRKGADIVKIVTTAHNTSDAARVMQLYSYKKSDAELVPCNFMERGEESGSLSNSFGEEEAQLVAFCMGKAGQFTRHLCLQLGAPYTYAALDLESATAPGQYTAAQMEQLLDAANYPYSTLKLQETIFCTPDGNCGEEAGIPSVQIPCSKSIAQRAILAAALACGTTILENFEPCNDSAGAIEVIRKLGARVECNGNTLIVESAGAGSLKGVTSIFTGESGLLTRLLIPLAACLSAWKANAGGGVPDGADSGIEITGHGSILKRNLGESVAALAAAGAQCSSNGGFLPLKVSVPQGRLSSEIEFSGKESSQIVSGFLMMLPLLEEDSTLTVTNPTSIPYIELTLRVLRQFGIQISQQEHLPNSIVYTIPGRQQYSPARIYLDPDWSSAANFAVAGALLGGIELDNMPLGSAQADEEILNLLEKFGFSVNKNLKNNGLYKIFIGSRVSGSGKVDDLLPEKIAARSASLRDCPDLFPIVAFLACSVPGETVLEGVERLAQKESNRAESIYTELSKLGCSIRIEGDKMYICGKPAGWDTGEGEQAGGAILGCGHNDHRIAMMLHVAALTGSREIKLDNIKCIDKSFPSFVEKLKK